MYLSFGKLHVMIRLYVIIFHVMGRFQWRYLVFFMIIKDVWVAMRWISKIGIWGLFLQDFICPTLLNTPPTRGLENNKNQFRFCEQILWKLSFEVVMDLIILNVFYEHTLSISLSLFMLFEMHRKKIVDQNYTKFFLWDSIIFSFSPIQSTVSSVSTEITWEWILR